MPRWTQRIRPATTEWYDDYNGQSKYYGDVAVIPTLRTASNGWGKCGKCIFLCVRRLVWISFGTPPQCKSVLSIKYYRLQCQMRCDAAATIDEMWWVGLGCLWFCIFFFRLSNSIHSYTEICFMISIFKISKFYFAHNCIFYFFF